MSTRDKVKTSVKRSNNSKRNTDLFVRWKMWISLALSYFVKDRGVIPGDIGNRILISNNMYATKAYLSSIIHVSSLSLETPVTLIQCINEELRKSDSSAVVDITLKNQPYNVQLRDSGLTSRIQMWEASMKVDYVPDRVKETAARCLYTVEQAKQGKRLFKTRMYITVRAKTGHDLSNAENIIMRYLAKIDATFTRVKGSMRETLQYITIMSDWSDVKLKDVKHLTTSELTLSQMVPNTGSLNDRNGLYVGVNILNNSPFKIDLRKITIARNMYIIAPSGVGKTVLALNLVSSAIEDDYAVCIQDIKGNEFSSFIRSVGGYIVSLRQTSSGYINSFRMYEKDVEDYNNAEFYFRQRIAFSKEQMLIITGLEGNERDELEQLLDEFLDALYISLGVLSNNMNTWSKTLTLDPNVVYEKLVEYATPTVQAKYAKVYKNAFATYRMYMSKSGSKSYVFQNEFDYKSIMNSKAIMFDFGMLEGSQDQVDPNLFRLKFAYMRKLNAEYVAYNYSKGLKTFKVLEESQIAVNYPDVMKGYVEEYTLRRAQGQSTLLLGNSISALTQNVASKPLIENTRAIFVGRLEREAREEVIRQFDLEDKRELLESIGSDAEHDNSFLFVNNMESKSLTPIVKVILDRNKKYKLLTPDAQNVMLG